MYFVLSEMGRKIDDFKNSNCVETYTFGINVCVFKCSYTVIAIQLFTREMM